MAAGGTDALRGVLGPGAAGRIAVAIDSGWLRRPWGDELEAAQVSASEPLNAKKIERALRDAWGPTGEAGPTRSPRLATSTAGCKRFGASNDPYPIQFGQGDWMTVVTKATGTFTGEQKLSSKDLPVPEITFPSGRASNHESDRANVPGRVPTP